MEFTIRPEWTPLTILLLVMGFQTWLPVGLLILAYILLGERLQYWGGRGGFLLRKLEQKIYVAKPTMGGDRDLHVHRQQVLASLEEERKEIEHKYMEFEDFIRALRRAKSRLEFDFMMKNRPKKRRARKKKALVKPEEEMLTIDAR